MDKYDPNEYARQEANKQYSKKTKGYKAEFDDATDELKIKVSKMFNIEIFSGVISKIEILQSSKEEHAHYAYCKDWLYKIKKLDDILGIILILYTASGILNSIASFKFISIPILLAVFGIGAFSIIKRFIPIAAIFLAGTTIYQLFVIIKIIGSLLIGGNPFIYYIIFTINSIIWFLFAMFINNSLIYKAISKTEGFPMFLEFMDKNTRRDIAVASTTQRVIEKNKNNFEDIEIDLTDIYK